jgi:AsmA protein
VRVLKWFVIVVAALMVAMALFIAFGLNTLRGPISKAVSKATGRELTIEGDLRAVWSWKHPRFRAEKVTLANPDWAREDYMFYADAVEGSVKVLPLLAGRVVLPEVHLQRPEIYLEIAGDGNKNWIMGDPKRDDAKKDSRVYIQALTFDNAYLKYFDPNRGMDLAAELATRQEGVAFEASGLYNGMQAAAGGQGGQVMGLKEATKPYPVKAEVKIGDTHASAEGTITNVAELGALDLKIDVRGKTMQDLYDIVGIAFPETKPYATSGHLVRGQGVVRYEDFKGKVGDSDLSGTLQVKTDGKRPFMTGDLVSKVLNFADLGQVVGTDQPKENGVLPDMPFDSDRWDSVDADVKLRAASIRRPKALPIENLNTRIVMKDKVLTLDPLEFGVAGGRIAGPVKLDGRKDPIQADTRLRVTNLELAKLMPTLKEGQNSIGAVNGIAELTGRGDSVGDMLASANGKLGVYIEEGEVSRFLMELVAIDIWGIARTKLKGDEPVGIRCAIVDLNVQKGVARTNAFVFDTSLVNVEGSGMVNLKTEEMDITLKPTPKQPSIASLNSPLYIKGTFSAPKVGPDVGKVAAKGVGALVMGILNPVLSVLPLMKEGKDKDSNCTQLIAEASKSKGIARTAVEGTTDPKSAAAGASAPKGSGKEPPSSRELRKEEDDGKVAEKNRKRDARQQAPLSQP